MIGQDKQLRNMTNIEKGMQGEAMATKYLESLGYEILETNYRVSHAEVDIIARINKEIVFIEVKTRTYDYYGSPEEFVTKIKQNNLAFAASMYCADNEYEGEIRFDIIAIILKDSCKTFKHIEDAFFPGL